MVLAAITAFALVLGSLGCAAERGEEGGEEPATHQAPAPARDEPGSPIVLEGRFAGFELGDYPHLHVERVLGPDCDFWGGDLWSVDNESSLLERLQTDASLLDRPVAVAHQLERRFIPEAQAEMVLAAPDAVSFSDLASSRAESETLAEIDRIRRAAHAYVSEVSGGIDHPLRIDDIGLRGDDAVAVAVYGAHPMPDWSHSWVFLERRDDRWAGVDYGSGLEAPDWYDCAAEPVGPTGDGVGSWAGTHVWEEDGVRHGGEGGIYRSVVWTLEVDAQGRGRLDIDGFQTSDSYPVELDGDAREARVVLRQGASRADDIAAGETLLTLYRPAGSRGRKALTKLDRLTPRMEEPEDVWAVRFR